MNSIFAVRIRCFFFIQDKFYEVYRNCLKVVANVTSQLSGIGKTSNSSLNWLLMRTQMIGEAGESDSTMKIEIQKLRSNIREIYYRKFFWNNTRIGIDG